MWRLSVPKKERKSHFCPRCCNATKRMQQNFRFLLQLLRDAPLRAREMKLMKELDFRGPRNTSASNDSQIRDRQVHNRTTPKKKSKTFNLNHLSLQAVTATLNLKFPYKVQPHKCCKITNEKYNSIIRGKHKLVRSNKNCDAILYF